MITAIAIITISITTYQPWIGGDACYSFVDGKCISRTASGKRWERLVDKGCACPREYRFGTKFCVDGKCWACWDRGGKIYTERNGDVRVDLLTAYHRLDGTDQRAKVVFPMGHKIPPEGWL